MIERKMDLGELPSLLRRIMRKHGIKDVIEYFNACNELTTISHFDIYSREFFLKTFIEPQLLHVKTKAFSE